MSEGSPEIISSLGHHKLVHVIVALSLNKNPRAITKEDVN